MASFQFTENTAVWRLILLQTGIGWAMITSSFAQVDADPSSVPVPPRALSLTIEVVRGGSVEVPLRAERRGARQVAFVLRSPPKHGSLGAVRMNARDHATVIYSHDGSREADVDSFRYAARAEGVGVSAAADVLIRVVDPPGQLEVPDLIDFGMRFVGEEVSTEFVIRNTGGTTVGGRMSATPPWNVGPDDRYSLAPGAAAKYQLATTHDIRGELRGEIRFSHDNSIVVPFRASILPPVETDPSSLDAPGAWGPGREAFITIFNRMKMPVTLAIKAPDGLEVQEVLDLDAGSHGRLRLRAAEDIPGAISGSLVLSFDSSRVEVPVAVPALPGTLRVAPPAVAMGALRPGEVRAVSFLVSNTGGESVGVLLQEVEGVLARSHPATFQLDPGETRTVTLDVRAPNDAGISWVREVRLEAPHAALTASIRFTGLTVPFPSKAEKPAGIPNDAGPEDRSRTTPPAAGPVPEGLLRELRENVVPCAVQVSLDRVGSRWADLSWVIPVEMLQAGRTVDLYFERYSTDKEGNPAFEWIKVEDADIQKSGENASVRVKNLLPMHTYSLWIAPDVNGEISSGDGRVFSAVPVPMFVTPATKVQWFAYSLRSGWLLWLLLLLLVVLGVARRARKRADRRGAAGY